MTLSVNRAFGLKRATTNIRVGLSIASTRISSLSTCANS